MNAAQVVRTARQRAGLTLRALAEAAGTSHSALAAYEAGSKVPGAATLDRIVRAAGFELDITLSKRIRPPAPVTRGDELAAVLELAETFPARHAESIEYPVFGR